ncbi:ATP-binding protein [Streptomyces sp. NPDC020800]|uniref:ATP-binding protein n=1 Tax=Streptomyces sp. NPDC020800 TaxID=3365092 RepID=UPI003788E5AC
MASVQKPERMPAVFKADETTDPQIEDALRRARQTDPAEAQPVSSNHAEPSAGMPALLPATQPGVYFRPRNGGFVAHVTASGPLLSQVRGLSKGILLGYGVEQQSAEAAQLVLSELVGNAVRACGDGVPLVIEVYVFDAQVTVAVHDPESDLLPQPGNGALDDAEAESGRGLALLDLLCTEVSVCPSDIGKLIRCQLAAV